MKKGIIPIVLGTGVTIAGIYMKKKSLKQKLIFEISTMMTSSLVGFGLAHILLGSIDYCQNDEYED